MHINHLYLEAYIMNKENIKKVVLAYSATKQN